MRGPKARTVLDLPGTRVLPPDPTGRVYYRDILGDWWVVPPGLPPIRLADLVARGLLERGGVETEWLRGRDVRRLAREAGYPIPRSGRDGV